MEDLVKERRVKLIKMKRLAKFRHVDGMEEVRLQQKLLRELAVLHDNLCGVRK